MKLKQLLERINKYIAECGDYDIRFFSQEGEGAPVIGISQEEKLIMINTYEVQHDIH